MGLVTYMLSNSPFYPGRHGCAVSHHRGSVLAQLGEVRAGSPGCDLLSMAQTRVISLPGHGYTSFNKGKCF